MNPVSIAAVWLVAACVSGVWPQAAPGKILVTLPPSVDVSRCVVHYFLRGPFGGVSRFARNLASVFTLETDYEGQAGQGLKAIVHCLGLQVETLVFDALTDVPGRVELNPMPIRALPFHGEIRGLVSQNVQELYVDVGYTPWWVCEFFGMVDCGLGPWSVASAPVSADGAFSVWLPDFAHDPVIRSFRDLGELAFRIRDPKTLNVLFVLKPTAGASALGRVPVAADYSGEHVFDAELPR